MSKVFAKIAGFFRTRTPMGVDKAGNRYFTRNEEIDGVVKEKRWVIFKGEHEPTSVPVEWISWLNGQRKRAPTPEEMNELEARRERVRLNVALLKKEEEEKRAAEGSARKVVRSTGKVGGPDLKSFIQQFPDTQQGNEVEETSKGTNGVRTKQAETEKEAPPQPISSEPIGSGPSFKPGTWQPPM